MWPEEAKPGPRGPAGVAEVPVAARRTCLLVEPPFLKWRLRGSLRLRGSWGRGSRDVDGHVMLLSARWRLLDAQESYCLVLRALFFTLRRQAGFYFCFFNLRIEGFDRV